MAKVFECPSCGSPLTISGDETDVNCTYCGRTVVVPTELRNPPPAALHMPESGALFLEELAAAERARQAARPEPPRHRRSGCGCTGVFLAGLILVGLVLVSQLTNPRSARTTASSVAGLLGPRVTPMPTPFIQAFPGSLPRQARYANVEFNITEAKISNQVPGSSDPKPRYAADRAYAYITASVKNPLDTYVQILQNHVALQTADGQLYQDVNNWSDYLDAQASKDEHWTFKLPAGATWTGARLVFGPTSKEQTVLPLDGPAPKPAYPVKLAARGQAIAQKISYQIQDASLDVDFNGQRVDQGKRYLILGIRAISQSDTFGGEYLLDNNFRLIVGDLPLAPVKAPSEVLAPRSSYDGQVVFLIPADAAHADLQLGLISGGQFAKIGLDLKK